MKANIFIIIISILFLNSACDFVNRKVKGGIDRALRLTGSLVVEFLTLPDRSLLRDVRKNELYGNWALVEESIENLNQQQKDYPSWESIIFPSMRFELKEDSVVEAWIYESYLPISFYKYPVTVDDSTMIIGKWYVGMDSFSSDKSNTYKNKLFLDFNFNAIVDLDIAEHDGELSLWSYIGDPDNLYYQEYIRVINKRDDQYRDLPAN